MKAEQTMTPQEIKTWEREGFSLGGFESHPQACTTCLHGPSSHSVFGVARTNNPCHHKKRCGCKRYEGTLRVEGLTSD